MSGSKINSNEAALYDRQIRLWGVHAQNQLKNSRILIVGLNALGAELCKNIVLAGLNVSLMDSVIVSERDLGAQFFLRAEDVDVGKTRAHASLSRIQDLNPFATVKALEGDVSGKTSAFFDDFGMVILVNQSHTDELHVNKCCRESGRCKFIAAHSNGYFATAFADFLQHKYVVSGIGGSIVSDAPETVNYISLEETYKLSWGELDSRFRHGLSPLFFNLQSNHELSVQGTLEEATASFVSLCKSRGVADTHINTEKFQQWYATRGSHLSPVCAIMGGLLGQEVIKVISGQNKPCDNWLFFDGLSGAAVMQRLTLEEKAKVEIPDAELIDDLLSDSD